MLIDFHTHCFPDTIAERAVTKLAGIGNIPYHTIATAKDNISFMKKCGIDKAVICNIATNVKQQTNVNNFAIDLNNSYDELYALGSIHPDCPYDEAKSELCRLSESGIKGIKVHPDYMDTVLDDDKFLRIFEICASLTPTLFANFLTLIFLSYIIIVRFLPIFICYLTFIFNNRLKLDRQLIFCYNNLALSARKELSFLTQFLFLPCSCGNGDA